MIALEEALVSHLGDAATVDGHDIGSGEFNIFIWTDEPLATFEQIKAVPIFDSVAHRLASGFRHEDGESYTPVYPSGLSDFSVA